MDNQYTWIPFYMELANKLRDYSDNRSELIQMITDVYDKLGIPLPTLEKDGMHPVDIDPFTVFGLFNKGIKEKTRIAICTALAEHLHINADIPNDFNGIPILNNMKATFYYFIEKQGRGEQDIDNLWKVFIAALNYADEQSESNQSEFCKYYDIVSKQKGIRRNLTIGLFWIRPYHYLNLDSCNTDFLKNSNTNPDNVRELVSAYKGGLPSADAYLQLCAECKETFQTAGLGYNSFPSMSYYAWSQSKTATDSEETEWFPSLDEYTPGFSVDDWLNLLNDKEVFDENSLIVIQRIYEMGGQATCKELSVQYGHDSGFYNIVSTKLAMRIHKKTNCPLIKDELSKDSKWWPILYRGHRAGKEIKGAYVWKLRDELKDAIDYWEDARNDKNRRYWLYAPGENACYWDEFYENEIMAIGWDRMGDLRQYQNREELLQKLQESNQTTVSQNTNSLQLWNFAFLMKPGDVVFCKKGMHYIIGCGIVTSNYVYDDEREKYKNVRAVKWTNKGEWYRSDQIVMKTLTDITDNKPYIDELIKLVGFNNDEQNNNETTMPCNLSYTKSSFLKEVFITESEYDKLRSLVLRKKNVILQGAPGVGKTYSAKRLAFSIIGEKNESRVCMVQFHQSYSYEDFIMGYRPNDSGGFTPTKGVFYRFCETACNDTDNDYFFIIDEINRGNLSKIFGELLMLIESDKRGKEHQLQLVYGGKPFYIPENLHIIGMMNTADRSLAMIDYALRRRFSFYTMQPAFENADKNGFGDYTGKVECKLYHTVIARIKDLNNAIRKDSTLGKGFEIGHSYFAPEDTSVIDDEWVRNVVEFEIIPLIEEYWFDNDKKLDEWTKVLYQAIGEDYDS